MEHTPATTGVDDSDRSRHVATARTQIFEENFKEFKCGEKNYNNNKDGTISDAITRQIG